jgi:hypothetical protein
VFVVTDAFVRTAHVENGKSGKAVGEQQHVLDQIVVVWSGWLRSSRRGNPAYSSLDVGRFGLRTAGDE